MEVTHLTSDGFKTMSKLYAINEGEALKKLEAMTDEEFNKFLASCPQRVQLLVRGGMVEWKKVLPAWYMIIPF